MKVLGASHVRTALGLTLCSTLLTGAAAAAAPECVSLTADGPLQITPECIDPTYNTPIITGETDQTTPVPHHRVSGYFNSTSLDFNIYLPPKEHWAGRFFQLVYPLQNSTAEGEAIAFGVESGAYTVRVAAGGGYRGDAAVAKFSKTVAREYYEDDKSTEIHGYIYGGSGGSLQTIGAVENTAGVWDGGIALIQAIPMSNPNNWAIRALAGIVLHAKSEQVIGALRPGGSGDPFAGLEEYERLVLEEATALGVPLHAWEDFDGVAGNRTGLYNVLRTLVIPVLKDADPSYVDDFWGARGYLGVEDLALGAFFRESLVEYNDTVQEVEIDAEGIPVAIKLDADVIPDGVSPVGLEFTIINVNGDQELGSFTGLLNKSDGSVYIYSDNDASVITNLAASVQLQIDNRWYLAAHTWHRHQVPPVKDGYYGYDYLRNEDGVPIYPQRGALLAPTISVGASDGGTHTGAIKSKLFVMDNLGDYDAFPWHADWYTNQVRTALGEEQFKNNYRLYYNEHADHQMGPVPQSLQARLVDFTGLYEWLLVALSAWVEDGVEPPVQSLYRAVHGQIDVPDSASARAGIQPVINMTVDGANRTEIAAGESAQFRVQAEAPPGAGMIVSVEWDFEGAGEFVKEEFKTARTSADISVQHVYATAGTYLPAVRVASHRDGDTRTAFARALNLGRVRVTVT